MTATTAKTNEGDSSSMDRRPTPLDVVGAIILAIALGVTIAVWVAVAARYAGGS